MVYNNSVGVFQNNSDVNLRGITLYNNTEGNVVLNNSNNIFLDANISGGAYGVYANGVNRLTIGNYSDIEIQNTTRCGICLYSTNYTYIAPYGNNVVIHNNINNLLLSGSWYNYFEGLLVYGGNVGVNFTSSNNNTFRSSNVSQFNNYNFYLNNSNNNTVYDNWVSNSSGGKDAYDSGSNIWSITKTSGQNIIGGSFLGGNFWSSYTGQDVDNEGL